MELSSIILSFALIGIFWFWWRTMQAREYAEKLARLACQREHVQFLDGTVALKRIRYIKDKRGNYHLLRYFGFEFSVSGSDRYPGVVTMRAMVQQYLHMDLPERPTITVDSETENVETSIKKLH